MIEHKACYPHHGYMDTSDGKRFIFLPILELCLEIDPAWPNRHELSAVPYIVEDACRLGVCTQELDYWRYVSSIKAFDNEGWSQLGRASHLIPFHTEVSFIFLKKLLDGVVDGLRPALFRHPKSAPREFKNLLREARVFDGIESETDRVRIQELVDDSRRLFDLLAKREDNSEEQGIRNLLMHRYSACQTVFHSGHLGNGQSVLQEIMGGNNRKRNLLHKLREGLQLFCNFCTEICSIIAPGIVYDGLFARIEVWSGAAKGDSVWPECKLRPV